MNRSLMMMLTFGCLFQLSEFESDFIETPSSQLICEPNGEAVFRCGHRSAQAQINWKIDGIPVHNFTDIIHGSSRLDGSGAIVYTLTVPARPEYNAIEVVCLAFFADGSPTEATPPVNLTIMTNVLTDHVSRDTDSACYNYTTESTSPLINILATTKVDTQSSSSAKWTFVTVTVITVVLLTAIIILIPFVVLARQYCISWRKRRSGLTSVHHPDPECPLSSPEVRERIHESVHQHVPGPHENALLLDSSVIASEVSYHKNEQVDMLESDTQYETVQLGNEIDGGGHIRIEMVTTSPPIVSGERSPVDGAPSLPPPRLTDPAVTIIDSRKTHQQPEPEGIVYDSIKAFQKNGQQYAITGNLKTKKPVDDPNHIVYNGEIQRIHSCQHYIADTSTQTASTTQLTEDNDPTPKPVTLEHLQSKLLPLASKWQSLGEALSLDEDQLDEILTNNETDENRLQEMLKLYFKLANPDLNHSWNEIQEGLKKIGETLTTYQQQLLTSPTKDSAIAVQPEVSLIEDSSLDQKGVSPCGQSLDNIDDSGVSESPAATLESPKTTVTVLNWNASTPKSDGSNNLPVVIPPLSDIRKTNTTENKRFTSRVLFRKEGASTNEIEINSCAKEGQPQSHSDSGFAEDAK